MIVAQKKRSEEDMTLKREFLAKREQITITQHICISILQVMITNRGECPTVNDESIQLCSEKENEFFKRA